MDMVAGRLSPRATIFSGVSTFGKQSGGGAVDAFVCRLGGKHHRDEQSSY
jgi:hypothetical protein